MSILLVTLTFDSVNVSVQVGDTAYFSLDMGTWGGFDTSERSVTKKLG